MCFFGSHCSAVWEIKVRYKITATLYKTCVDYVVGGLVYHFRLPSIMLLLYIYENSRPVATLGPIEFQRAYCTDDNGSYLIK